MKISIVTDRYDLENSFRPSFVSSLFEVIRFRRWRKVAGWLKGAFIEQREENIIVEFSEKVCQEELKNFLLLITGLWRKRPYEEDLSKLPSKFRRISEKLSTVYPGVRIPVSPKDFVLILISVILSKRTDYHRFVKRWCLQIWKKFGDDFKSILRADLEQIGTSYQLRDMKKTLRDFLEKIGQENIVEMDPDLVRLYLIDKCWGIGPKVADSILLNCFKPAKFIPCDVHLVSFVRRTKLVEKFRLPRKDYCRRFVCTKESSRKTGFEICPISKECLRAILLEKLGEFSGWFQTLVYLHGRDFCKPIPRCEKCPVKEFCIVLEAR